MAAGILVLPFEGFGVGGVSANVALQLAYQIGDGREHTTRNDFPLDAQEPDLYLAEPGRVGGSEV